MKLKLSRRAMLGSRPGRWRSRLRWHSAKSIDSHEHPRAYLDGTGPGWKELAEDDFTHVNCDPDTWTWKDGVIHCTGHPVGVIRTRSR